MRFKSILSSGLPSQFVAAIVLLGEDSFLLLVKFVIFKPDTHLWVSGGYLISAKAAETFSVVSTAFLLFNN
jgi:hypothetical protein